MRLGRASQIWAAMIAGGCILYVGACKREAGEADRAAADDKLGGDVAASAEARSTDVEVFPDWAVDARWYYIDVPNFHNGERSNNPAGESPYGGDVEGVRQRLSYLRELGVNALLLGRALPRSPTSTGATAALAELVRDAHAQDFHVVLMADSVSGGEDRARSATAEQKFLAEALRWMDPNGDGDPSDGVDGWCLEPGKLSPQLLEDWREKFTRVNPQALLLVRDQPFGYLPVASMLLPERRSEREKLLAELRGEATARAELGVLSDLHAAGYWADSESARAVGAQVEFAFRASYGDATAAKQDARWRLATVLLHFLPGTPVTVYGEEVGLFRGDGAAANPPMWWNDLPDPKTKSADYRGDFFSLVRWLHSMRAEHAPLRRGSSRAILLDESRKTLAFARSLPGEEVALAVNFGDTKQKVMLSIGKPGQLVYVLSPALDPERAIRFWKRQKSGYDRTEIHRLRVGGSKQFVNREGKIRLWVKAMSVRVVLVFD